MNQFQNYPEPVLAAARSFVNKPIYYFSELEERALRWFFTNVDRRVFFVHTLPTAVGVVLLAMYSRMKNKRGLRGVFVDQFLPQFLATMLQETAEKFDGKGDAFVKAHRIDSLAAFVGHSRESAAAFEEFLGAFSVDADYIRKFAAAEKVKRFTATYLDQYGHKSIARMGCAWVCFELVSILAVKSIEWGRPGMGYTGEGYEDVGYIELSTRYVDMSAGGVYPIEAELAYYGVPRRMITDAAERSFDYYRRFEGSHFDGPFPEHLRQTYGHLHAYADAPKDFEQGVIGETCDVLGNFLPASALTSVGCAVSGEAMPELVRHLYLDNTPENIALAEAVVAEAAKLGLDQFLRHTELTPWKVEFWKYLDLQHQDWWCIGAASHGSGVMLREPFISAATLPDRNYAEDALVRSFDRETKTRSFEGVMSRLLNTPRGEFDKLPNHFEKIAGEFAGAMSFRGWRDLQRQSFCTHNRTLLTPYLGFYKYDKLAPKGFYEACIAIHGLNAALYSHLLGAPAEIRQYPMALGNLVGFGMGGNFAQLEFCNWQRSKYSVNHEARQAFLGTEERLRKQYPWWHQISRADTTKAYVFARGNKKVPLVRTK